MSDPSVPVVRRMELRGHQGSVNCLDLPQQQQTQDLLLSGSEDCTARLWDLRQKATGGRSSNNCCLCIPCSHEVTAVTFGPTLPATVTAATTTAATATTTRSSVFARDVTVFVSYDNQVFGYDLRKATSPIFSDTIMSRPLLFQGTEEINQILVSYPQQHQQQQQQSHNKKKNSAAAAISNPSCSDNNNNYYYLATVDDAGHIRVLPQPTTTTTIQQQLPNHHQVQVWEHPPVPYAAAMILSASFRPTTTTTTTKIPKKQNHKPNQEEQPPDAWLATGGTDCAVCLWNIPSYRQCVFHEVLNVSSSSVNQLCNPPMVHTLHWSQTGQLLCAGLGDGSLAVYTFSPTTRTTTNKLQLQLRLEQAHTGSIASILFPDWKPYKNNSTKSKSNHNDRLLLSAGTDGMIVIWDLGSTMSSSPSPADWFPKGMCTTTTTTTTTTTGVDNTEEDDFMPHTLFAIPHGPKINAMVATSNHPTTTATTSTPTTIFVADTSSIITGYSLPVLQ